VTSQADARAESLTTRSEAATSSGNVGRLLFLRTDAIGDNVLASAMLSHIRARFAGAEISVLCQDHIAELYESCPFVDRVLSYSDVRFRTDLSYRSELLASLQSEHFDLLLNSVLSRDSVSDALGIGCVARESIAFRGDLSNMSATEREANNRLYTRLIDNSGQAMTELERHREFLAGLGIQADTLEPLVWTTPEDDAFADDLLASLSIEPGTALAVFPGAQHSFKRWQHIDEVLAEFPSLPVIILGAESDSEESARICAAFKGGAVNLSGGTTLRQIAAVMQRCRGYLGNDSAGVHIACAVGIPNVCVTGGGHFGRFVPYSRWTTSVTLPLGCFQCNWSCPCEPKAPCIGLLTPGVVAAALRVSLERDARRPLVVMQSRTLGFARTLSWKRRLVRGPYRWRDCSDAVRTPCDSLLVSPGGRILRQGNSSRGSAPQPLVSVLTPSFNQGAYIGATLQSVEEQTYKHVEHIVMDGGSDDGTLDVLRAAGPRVAWRSEPDRGQADAVNKAFEASRGEIIGWLNSDDAYYDIRAIEDVVTYFEQHPEVDVVYGHAARALADGRIVRILHVPRFSRAHLLWECFLVQPAAFIRRAAIEAPMLDDEFHFAMDWELWLRLARTRRFARIDRVLAVDRSQPDRKILTQQDVLAADRRRLESMYGVRPVSWRHWIHRVRGVAGRLAAVRHALFPVAPLAFPGSQAPKWELVRTLIGSRSSKWPEGYR
jgi:ADP-heptose:LPS heptosyltransferase